MFPATKRDPVYLVTNLIIIINITIIVVVVVIVTIILTSV